MSAAIRSSRRLLLALAVLAGLTSVFLLATPPRIEAQGRCGNEFYYYNNAAHDELVGWEVYECNCAHFSWGVKSFYREIVPLDC